MHRGRNHQNWRRRLGDESFSTVVFSAYRIIAVNCDDPRKDVMSALGRALHSTLRELVELYKSGVTCRKWAIVDQNQRMKLTHCDRPMHHIVSFHNLRKVYMPFIEGCHFNDLEWPPKVTTFFNVTELCLHSRLIGSRTSNSAIFNGIQWPITQVSRARH